MLTHVVRPLEPWTEPAVVRKSSTFSASWSSTMDLLDRELWALRHVHPDVVGGDGDLMARLNAARDLLVGAS
jgi:hypothetical protein